MLSRVAESLFWLGRYTERAENYASFIYTNSNLTLDLPPGVKEQWRPLILATGDEKVYLSHYEGYKRHDALKFLGYDHENANSILQSIEKARENARQIRDSISNDTWEVLNDLYHFNKNCKKRKVWSLSDAECFKQTKQKLQLLQGIAYDTAPRTQGWYFSQLGKYIERADKISRILDVKYHTLLPSIEDVGSPLDFLHWTALLNSLSAFNAYRKFYGKIDPKNIVEYILLNRHFPKSILFCLSNAEICLREISHEQFGYSNEAERKLGLLRSELEYANITDIFNQGLHEYLDDLQIKLNDISSAVSEKYFKVQPNFVEESVQSQVQG